MADVEDECTPCDASIRERMKNVHWVPLESNPEMLTDFAQQVGMPSSWAFTDIFGLDEELLAMVPPGAVAVTLLFDSSRDVMRKWKAEQKAAIQASGQKISPSLKHLRQYVGNACGTIATIHSLANNAEALGLSADSPLGKFLAAADGKTPDDIGIMLADAKDLHTASEASAQGGQTAAPEADADVNNHFIVFVEKDGDIYELDGTKAFPINHGAVEGSLLFTAAKVIKKNFMEKDPDSMHFNMMALVKDD